MKVEVKELRTAGDVSTVVVATAIGTAELVLASSRARASVGTRCDAELEVRAVARREETVFPSSDGVFLLDTEGDTTNMAGRVEAVESDGVAILRLAPDLLVLIEVALGAVVAGEWVRIALPLRSIAVYLTY